MEMKEGFNQHVIEEIGQHILDIMHYEQSDPEDMMKLLGCFMLNVGGDINMSPNEMKDFLHNLNLEYRIIRRARFG